MTKLDLTKLTNEALQIELKKKKSSSKLLTVVIGLMIGTAIFTTFKKGFDFFTVFPLFFIPLAITSKSSYDEVKKEIESRNL